MNGLADDLRLALDPVAFARELLGWEPDPWQEKVLQTPSKRILLNCNRQSGKSTTTAILGLHTALYRPRSLILLISPSLRQSKELLAKVQGFFKLLPEKAKPDEDNKLAMTLSNGSRIVAVPNSPDKIRGFSAVDLLIEDEAAFCSDILYRSIRPMLATSQGRLILMSTPYGKQGHFFEEWQDGGDSWEKIKITAYDCPRISKEFLAEERQSMGDRWFQQEYTGVFSDRVDSLFTYNMIEDATTCDVSPLFFDDEKIDTSEVIKPLFS